MTDTGGPVARLAELAREAVNSWACYARRAAEHDAIARLHGEIDAALRASAPPEGGRDGNRIPSVHTSAEGGQFVPIDRSDMDTVSPCGHYMRFRLPCMDEDGNETMECMQCDRDRANRLLADAEERAHLAQGVAELAMKHRDEAERRMAEGGQGAADLVKLARETLAKVKASIAKAEYARPGWGPAAARDEQLDIILAALRRAAPAVGEDE